MTTRDFTQLLTMTADLADRVINRPSMTPASGEIEKWRSTLIEARQLMVEGGNPIGMAAVILLDALVELERARKIGEVTTHWAMVAGVLLPMVRENLVAAMMQSRQARA